MVAEQRRISFEEFVRTLNAVFDEVAKHQEPILVQRGGRFYRLAPAAGDETSDIWANYDPARAWESMQAAIGALAGVDTARLKADIKAARAQDSTGRPGE